MTETPTNVLLIQTDQHNPMMMGCSGNDFIDTPALDSLAESGTRFENAYCQSPICVPSRASMATGRYPHQTRNWDNAAPYIGTEADSWATRVFDGGGHVTTIGKLHFRRQDDPSGFSDQRFPMHVLNGQGDLYPLLRGDAEPKPESRIIVTKAGPGESSYTTYDRQVADSAATWLAEEASQVSAPWVLYVSFVCPHFPLIAPPEHYAKFDVDDVPMPVNWRPEDWPMHPAIQRLRYLENLEEPFTDAQVRNAIVAYYAMVSFIDEQIAVVLNGLRSSGLTDSTRIIYTSDHGDMVGQHGLWSKHSMYEPSVGVPMIVSGPDIPAGQVSRTNVSLTDVFPTILHATGTSTTEADHDLPGGSLLDLTDGFVSRDAFSEYHANYSSHASFMLKRDNLKYIHHVDAGTQIFDLEADPMETNDLTDTIDDRTRDDLQQALHRIVDPEETDQQAKADGEKRLDEAGGREAVKSRGIKVPFSPTPA